MRIVKLTPAHQAAYDDAVAALRKHADNLQPEEMLAIYAKITGRVLAMLDQRKYTPAAGLKIISVNIEVGNAEMIAEVSGPSKGNA